MSDMLCGGQLNVERDEAKCSIPSAGLARRQLGTDRTDIWSAAVYGI